MVADGAYPKREFLRPAKVLGMTVVSRLRKDAALRTLPGPRPADKRGRPRTYGPDVIDLAKRGGQRRGWSSGTFDLYGEEVVKKSKTFLATWRPAGGAIRVVLVDEPAGWRAYFCTDTSASVAAILETIADRFSLEEVHEEAEKVVLVNMRPAKAMLDRRAVISRPSPKGGFPSKPKRPLIPARSDGPLRTRAGGWRPDSPGWRRGINCGRCLAGPAASLLRRYAPDLEQLPALGGVHDHAADTPANPARPRDCHRHVDRPPDLADYR